MGRYWYLAVNNNVIRHRRKGGFTWMVFPVAVGLACVYVAAMVWMHT